MNKCLIILFFFARCTDLVVVYFKNYNYFIRSNYSVIFRGDFCKGKIILVRKYPTFLMFIHSIKACSADEQQPTYGLGCVFSNQPALYM